MDCPDGFCTSSVSKSGTLLRHMVSSAPIPIHKSKISQRAWIEIRYDLACFANKMISRPHQNIHASERTQPRLYCLSLTHCPVYVEAVGFDPARCFTMGVASSFTRHRLGHFSSISTPPSSQHFPSTLAPLLSLTSLQFKATSPLLFHNHLRIPAG